MQTLGVTAARTREEYDSIERQKRDELLSEIRELANLFFIAAGMVAISSGILLIRINLGISIGLIDILYTYGARFGNLQPLMIYGAAIGFMAVLIALGWFAREGKRWPFIIGMILYALDTLALMLMFSFLSIGVHGFFLMRWFQGKTAVDDLTALTKPIASQSISASSVD